MTTSTRMQANVSRTPEQTRSVYRDDMTLREARAVYFANTGFDDRTYVDKWVELPVGSMTVRMFNIQARKDVVPVHDVNHIMTGYGTDWAGEFTISAFEMGMGCKTAWVAWLLNSGALIGGVAKCPRASLRAFARGRATHTSTYTLLPTWNPAVLDDTVGDWRKRIGLVDKARVGVVDVALFAVWTTLGLAANLITPAALGVGTVWAKLTRA